MERKKIKLVVVLLLIPLFSLLIGYDTDPIAQSATITSNDHLILAKMISGEARGEPYIGQVAVGGVILNRVRDERFPNTVYGVCFQPGAFDAVRDGQYYAHPTQDAIRAARDALNDWDPTHGALYYWNPVTATSRWIWTRTITLRIGRHVFGI